MIPETIIEWERYHLDAGYNRTAGPVLARIDKISTSPASEMQISLSNLDVETQGLTEKEDPILPTNKKLEKALNALGSVFISAQALIEAAGPAIQQSGVAVAPQAVTAKVFLNITDDLLANGIDPLSPKSAKFYSNAIKKTKGKFTVPSAKDIAANFVNTPKWKSKMDGWGAGYYGKTKDIFIQGLADGWSPKYTAARIRDVAENIPRSAAENLTRTLQNTSYREASLEMEKINGGMIYGKIRIATLDQRTCLSCIALHGTELEPGERVDDHYRGRCTEFYRVPGGPMFPESMQADSLPGKRNFVPWQKGTDWFASLPPKRQALQPSFKKSPAKLKAYRDGVPLSDFVGDHHDDVFGNQKIELSLLKMLGEDDAKKYYAVAKKAES